MTRNVKVLINIDGDIKVWQDVYDFSNSMIQCQDEQRYFIENDVKGIFQEADIISILIN